MRKQTFTVSVCILMLLVTTPSYGDQTIDVKRPSATHGAVLAQKVGELVKIFESERSKAERTSAKLSIKVAAGSELARRIEDVCEDLPDGDLTMFEDSVELLPKNTDRALALASYSLIMAAFIGPDGIKQLRSRASRNDLNEVFLGVKHGPAVLESWPLLRKVAGRPRFADFEVVSAIRPNMPFVDMIGQTLAVFKRWGIKLDHDNSSLEWDPRGGLITLTNTSSDRFKM